MPRRYSLGRRAESKADTRARIVAAATAIYFERGPAAASNLAIARAADVAPATVRNHFADEQALTEAVFDHLLAELGMPSADIFEGLEGIGPRVRAYAIELAAFFERSEPWWWATQREPDLAAWAQGTARYEEQIERIMRLALGPLAVDELAMTVLATLVGPPTFYGFRGRGLPSAEAAALGAELASPWLERRLAEQGPA